MLELSEEFKEELRQSILRNQQLILKGREDVIKFIEEVIKHNRRMAKIYKDSKFLGDKNELETTEERVKKWEVRLKEAKEKLIQAEMEYGKRCPETIQEKALKMGLTVIRGGALQ